MASLIPFFLSSFARLRKKLTVMGMMGHTQGVNRAMSPPSNPIRKMYQSERLCILWSPSSAFSSLITGCHRIESFPTSGAASASESTAAVSAARVSAFASSFSSSAASFTPSPL